MPKIHLNAARKQTLKIEDLYHKLPPIIEKIVERRLRLDSCSGNHLMVGVEGGRQSNKSTIDVETKVLKKSQQHDGNIGHDAVENERKHG